MLKSWFSLAKVESTNVVFKCSINIFSFISTAPIKRERDREMSGGDYTEHDFSQPPAKRASDFSRASLSSLAQSNFNEILAAAAASNGIAGPGNRNPFHHATNNMHEDDEREEAERDADMDDEAEDDEEARREAVNKLRAADSLHHLSNVAMMNHAKRQLGRDSVTRSPAFRPNNCDESEEEDEDAPSFMPNVFGGLQFKISKAGISESGEPELVVTMEINNVTYEGSLFAAATKKNLKAHKASHKLGTSPMSSSSPVKSTTSSAGSAVTTQMVSPKNGSHNHNNNDTDVMNNNCVNKNFLEPEVQIHSPPSPPPPPTAQPQVPLARPAIKAAPRIGQKVNESSFDEPTSGRMEEGVENEEDLRHHRGTAEEDLSMKSKKLSQLEEMHSQPMVSS